MKHVNIAIFIPHLGCPYRCIFCQQNRISHPGKAPSPSEIPRIIEDALSTIDPATTIVEAAFFGGSFTALPERSQRKYLEAVQPYLNNGKITSIRLSTRPDCINRSILEMLACYGVRTIELGVQSFDDEVLHISGRDYKSQKIEESCCLIKEAGLNLGIQLMIGLPGSDRNKEFYSTRMAVRLMPDLVRLYPTLVIDATELADLFRAGVYKPLDLDEAIDTVKEMYLAFQIKGIPVVRMGLHPSEELRSPGTVVAGPYHPAFGELVMQEVFKEQAVWLIKRFVNQYPTCAFPALKVNPRDLSKLLGWKKRNLVEIKTVTGVNDLLIDPSASVKRQDLRIYGNPGLEMEISRQQFLQLRSSMVYDES